MIIFLIFILTVASISLRIAISGLEVAYYVAERADKIRLEAEEQAVRYSKKHGHVAHASANIAKTSIDASVGFVKLGVNVGKSAIILATKSIIKLIRLIVKLLRDALVAMSLYVIILDIVVFLILTSASAGFAVLYSEIDDSGNISIKQELSLEKNNSNESDSNKEDAEESNETTEEVKEEE